MSEQIQIQDGVYRYTLFEENIILVDETKVGMNGVRDTLEIKGSSKINRSKTKYTTCNLSNSRRTNGDKVKLEGLNNLL